MLGPVDRVRAERGPRDTVSLLLHHTGGATSMSTVSREAPSAVDVVDLVVWGSRRRSWMPSGLSPPAEALGTAVRELIDGESCGAGPRCDLGFGRDVLEVIAAAAEQVDELTKR